MKTVNERLIRSFLLRCIPPRFRAARSEAGFTLVLLSLMATVLLGCAGLAIDFGNMYLNVQRTQRAADAAALAGAAYLPGDPTQANVAATATLASDGFRGSVVAMNPLSTNPTLMGVRLADEAHNSFLQFFKIKTFPFTRAAVAGYQAPLKMGSPSNVLGTETTSLPQVGVAANSFGAQTFSLASHASGIQKDLGDRWSTAWCSPPSRGTGCTGLTNNEYSPTQTYVVHVDQGYSGTLVIEAYDGGYSPQRDCTDSHMVEIWNAYGAGNPSYNPAITDACTHDGSVGSPVIQNTTFQVLQAPPHGAGIPLSECGPAAFTPLPDDLAVPWSSYFNPATAHGRFDPFYSYRKWDEFCRLDIGTVRPAGDYYITVRTADGSSQFNDFSLRAAFMNGATVDTAKSAHVSVYPKDRMTVNVHNRAQYLTMPIVQMNQGALGRAVRLESFDVADLAPGVVAPYMRLIPSGDWTNNGAPITSFPCTFTSSTGARSNLSDCRLNRIVSRVYSGKTIGFEFNLPTSYSCNWSSATGCWINLEVNYGPSTVYSDTTSWNLVGNGSPMRLYNASQFGF